MKYKDMPNEGKKEIYNRFIRKYDMNNQCWEWGASRQYQGYGLFQMGGRSHHAHRISWMIFRGEIPDGKCVLHHCDNPPCVNPNHLYIGTPADNARDRDTRGRANNLKGEEIPWAKLAEKDVLEIRRLYETGEYSYERLEEMFPVSDTQIGRIVRGERWKHI